MRSNNHGHALAFTPWCYTYVWAVAVLLRYLPKVHDDIMMTSPSLDDVIICYLSGPPPPFPTRSGLRNRAIIPHTTFRVLDRFIYWEDESSSLRGPCEGVDLHHSWFPDASFKVISYVLLGDVYTIPLESCNKIDTYVTSKIKFAATVQSHS